MFGQNQWMCMQRYVTFGSVDDKMHSKKSYNLLKYVKNYTYKQSINLWIKLFLLIKNPSQKHT